MPSGRRFAVIVASTGFSPCDGSSLFALRASVFSWTRAHLATDATKPRHLPLLHEPRAFALAGSTLSLNVGRRADDEPGSLLSSCARFGWLTSPAMTSHTKRCVAG